MKKLLVLGLGLLGAFCFGSSVNAMGSNTEQEEQMLVTGMERLQLSPPSLSPAESPAQKADQDEQTLVEGMERLRLSPSPQSPAEISAQKGNIKSAVKSAVYETNKPTSARLMVRYFDEMLEDITSGKMPPAIPCMQGYKFRSALDDFTKEEYLSAYPILPVGLFRCLPHPITFDRIEEVVELDMACVRTRLQTMGNGWDRTPMEEAAIIRLGRAQEFIQEARHDD